MKAIERIVVQCRQAIPVQCYGQRAAGLFRIMAAGSSLRNPHGKKSGGVGLGVMAAKANVRQYDPASPPVLQPPAQYSDTSANEDNSFRDHIR